MYAFFGQVVHALRPTCDTEEWNNQCIKKSLKIPKG